MRMRQIAETCNVSEVGGSINYACVNTSLTRMFLTYLNNHQALIRSADIAL